MKNENSYNYEPTNYGNEFCEKLLVHNRLGDTMSAEEIIVKTALHFSHKGDMNVIMAKFHGSGVSVSILGDGGYALVRPGEGRDGDVYEVESGFDSFEYDNEEGD